MNLLASACYNMVKDPPMLPGMRLTVRLLALAALLAAFETRAAAVQLSWYGDGKTLGGDGTWDTTSPNWSADGSTFGTWSNSGSNGATFDFNSGGGPGYVYVAEPITAVNLTFNDSGFELYSSSGSNAITLIGPTSIYVDAGSQATVFTASLAGAAGMTLSGGGELVLASSNTYTGATTVSGAYLDLASAGALPAGNLVIDGGVIELGAGNFSLGLGTAANQVRFTSNGGGFAAASSTYAVNLGGSSDTMTWGSTYFLPSSGTTSATLVLGSPWAAGTLDFQNPIDLGTANRTVQVNMGSGPVAANAKLSGPLSGSGGLIVTGDGVLALTASNAYSGGTTIGDGVLSVQNASALGSGGVALAGGTLQLAVAPSGSNAVTLAADSTIDITGTTAGALGNFAIGGNTLYVTGKSTSADTAYGLSLGRGTLGGNPTFNVANNGAGIGMLTLGSLSDGGAARTLTKSGSGALSLAASATSFVRGTTVNVSGGTLKCNAAAALGSFARVSVSRGAVLSLAATQQVSSLAGQGNVSLGGSLLIVGNSDNQSSDFSGILSGTGGALATQGSGTLVLDGTGSYTGGTYVEAGTLVLAGPAAIASGTRLTVGDPALFSPAPLVVLQPTIPDSTAIAPVPEPGTLGQVLVVSLVVALGLWRQASN